MIQSVRTRQWEPERICSLRNMITIMIIIINILYHHYYVGYLQLHIWNKPCFKSIQCCSCSIFTICATCNVISHVTYVLYYTLLLSELRMCAMSNTAVFLFLYIFDLMLSSYVTKVFPRWSWDSSSCPCYYWYHFCFWVIIINIIIININNKIANIVTAIPQTDLCSTGCSEVTIKGLKHEWANYLLENLFLMYATSKKMGNFYVLFPQNLR